MVKKKSLDDKVPPIEVATKEELRMIESYLAEMKKYYDHIKASIQ